MWRLFGGILFHTNSQSLPILATQGADFDPAIAGLGQNTDSFMME
jgi:hypothetical protein